MCDKWFLNLPVNAGAFNWVVDRGGTRERARKRACLISWLSNYAGRSCVISQNREAGSRGPVSSGSRNRPRLENGFIGVSCIAFSSQELGTNGAQTVVGVSPLQRLPCVAVADSPGRIYERRGGESRPESYASALWRLALRYIVKPINSTLKNTACRWNASEIPAREPDVRF